MTPQQLMDLPHAGMAEKQLRKQGDWELTKKEILREVIDRSRRLADKIRDDVSSLEDDLYKIHDLVEGLTCA